jgi:SAM-dependent methyltransferase
MKHFGKTYWRRHRNRLLKKQVAVEGRALDIGCGWRVYCQKAVRLDINLDYSPDVVADTQKSLCFRDNSFDTVLMFDVLEHLEYPHQALEEVKRVLKPGGILYITVPFCFPRHGVEYYRFSDLALKEMLKGFEVIVIPVKKSKLWNLVWNYYLQDTIIEGYFVKAIKNRE